MNIGVDKIECDSCGAHLIFTALTSWSPAEGMSCVSKFFHRPSQFKLTGPVLGLTCANVLHNVKP